MLNLLNLVMLNIVDKIEEREEINNKINFYRKSRVLENHIKDFYLKKLLDRKKSDSNGIYQTSD